MRHARRQVRTVKGTMSMVETYGWCMKHEAAKAGSCQVRRALNGCATAHNSTSALCLGPGLRVGNVKHYAFIHTLPLLS